jgi:hypothetical protein
MRVSEMKFLMQRRALLRAEDAIIKRYIKQTGNTAIDLILRKAMSQTTQFSPSLCPCTESELAEEPPDLEFD